MSAPSRAAASSARHETPAYAHHADLVCLTLVTCILRCNISSPSKESRSSRNRRSTYVSKRLYVLRSKLMATDLVLLHAQRGRSNCARLGAMDEMRQLELHPCPSWGFVQRYTLHR